MFARAEDTADSERWCECACLRMRALGSRLSMETGWLTIATVRAEAIRVPRSDLECRADTPQNRVKAADCFRARGLRFPKV